MSDFLIIGGGVMGMMTALQLADAGQQVTLVERGECGKEASWAGGGIVSPLYPWRYDAAISQLSRWSEGAYPSLALRLLEETCIDPEYRQRGLLYLNVDDADGALRWARQLGKPLERVGADFVHAKEPDVEMTGDSALWMPTLGSVRNPRLAKALKARLSAMPQVTLREQYQAPKGLLQRVVLKDGRYIIPRADGLLLVGSTLEEAGFDKTTDNAALASLKHSAETMLPALATCPVVHQWAGLRPGSPAGVPFIGALKEWPNVFVNAGHYRNGLVLAPASTHLLVDQLLEREPLIDPAPYQPTPERLIQA